MLTPTDTELTLCASSTFLVNSEGAKPPRTVRAASPHENEANECSSELRSDGVFTHVFVDRVPAACEVDRKETSMRIAWERSSHGPCERAFGPRADGERSDP